MKWILSLIMTVLLTLFGLLVDLFQHLVIPPALSDFTAFGGRLLTLQERYTISALILIVGLFATVRLALELVPDEFFVPAAARVLRLPNPKRIEDRVRRPGRKQRILNASFATPEARWMVPFGVLVLFTAFAALPIVLDGKVSAISWALSILLSLTCFGAAIAPDEPTSMLLTDQEIEELLRVPAPDPAPDPDPAAVPLATA